MEFISNKIALGESKSLKDLIASVRKQASTDDVVKTASVEDDSVEKAASENEEAVASENEEVKEDSDDEETEIEVEVEVKEEDKEEDKEEGKEEDKEEEDKEEEVKEEEVKEAKVQRFCKVAQLDEKTKKWMFDYWRNMYGEDYASAMIADK